MSRSSSESRAQRASRRGTSNNASSGSQNGAGDFYRQNGDEREQAAGPEERGRSRSRRRSSEKYNNEAAAAAADGAPNNYRRAEEVVANDVLGAFYNMLLQGAPPQQEAGDRNNSEEGSIQIDLRKASNVLEAAAGNLALAANLYWDDYFATQAADQFRAQADPPPKLDANNPIINPNDNPILDQKPAAEVVARGGPHRSFPLEQNQDIGMGSNNHNDDPMVANRRLSNPRSSVDSRKRSIELAADYPTPPKRRLRRSLDSDFQAADDNDETKQKKRAAKRARKSNENIDETKVDMNGLADDNEANEDDKKMPAIRRDGNQDVDNDKEARPPAKRRVDRGGGIRHQDIVQGGDNIGNESESEDNGDGSDGNEVQEDSDKNNERERRRRGRRQRRRGEPRRISAQVETSISVSDDELGKGGYSKNSKRRTSSSRRRSDRNLNRDPSNRMNGDSSNSATNDSHIVNRSAVMKAVEDINCKINPNSTQLSKPLTWFLSPEQKRKKRTRDNDDDDSVDTNTDDYISDDDWLGCETYSTPMEHLWGACIDQDSSSLPEPQGGEDCRNNDGGNGNVVADDDAMNVSGEEEDGYDNNIPSFRPASTTAEGPAFAGIPYTWLSAGFQLSECGSGLVVKSPNVEDIEFFSWRQQQINDKRNAIPPPYHCKALTAITSVVTGLLYAGVSIQGSEVNFTSGKKPWSSLPTDERKREFESRLSDVLSSLIFVAAQASLKRKERAYRKATRIPKSENAEKKYSDLLREAMAERKAALATNSNDNYGNDNGDNSRANENGVHNDDVKINNISAVVEDNMPNYANRQSKKKTVPASQEKKELMRRRLGLIPTCVWAETKTVVAPRAGDAPLYNSNIKVKMSWTNIRDIELYVRSNLRAFTEKGGIALFLETLLRIHGNGFIARQINRCASATVSFSGCSREDSGIQKVEATLAELVCSEENNCKTKITAGFPSLIRCTCEERQKKIYEEKPLPLNVRIDPSKLLDTTPTGTECASVELLTLMLTGRVSADWKDCSNEKLGIGLLTENMGDVSRGLARPKQPVWLLKGDSCYSVIHLDGSWSGSSNDSGRSRSKFYNGSSVGDDLTTISRVDKPGVSLNLCHWNGWYGQRSRTTMRLITSKLGKEIPSKNLLSRFSEQHESSLMRRLRYENVVDAVSAEEHESNEINEKENPIRPSELKRIKIHSEDRKLYPRNHKMWRFDIGNDDHKLPAVKVAENWVPYFLLTSRQKRMVETNLGPNINIILSTRWPGAIIDNFAPSEGGFPVV